MRGHWLGRPIWEGSAAPDTGEPGEIAGQGIARLLRSPADGIFEARVEIGDGVEAGQILATIGDVPLAMVNPQQITPLRPDYHARRQDRDVVVNTAFEEKVTILYYYPNMQPDIVDALV